jgi:predicted acyl esterase
MLVLSQKLTEGVFAGHGEWNDAPRAVSTDWSRSMFSLFSHRLPMVFLGACLTWVLPVAGGAAQTRYDVPMRDGVELATDVHLPIGEGPWPAVLARTPYGRAGGRSLARRANAKGYAVVMQDLRGRGASEGSHTLVVLAGRVQLPPDGYDAVEWVAAQPWCDGNVVTWGGSALGIDQLRMAPTRPPHLRAQHVYLVYYDMYADCAYQGGAWRAGLIETWIRDTKSSLVNLATFLAHPNYDAFWKSLDLKYAAPKVNVPIVFQGGWYDMFCQGTINAYLTINTHGDIGSRGKCRLIMGPWVHAEDYDFTGYPDASPPPAADAFRWYDHWVRGAKNGVGEEQPVHYYVMGALGENDAPGNVWRSAAGWPPPTQATPFYLHADGSLSRAKPSVASASRSYAYDPKSPVPTLGGAERRGRNGPKDQRPVEDRADVLLFTSPKLDAPLEMTGRIVAHLWVSSSARDTDFTVKLTDVYPDGRSMLVLDGILRARHRRSRCHEDLLEPDVIYPVEVDLWSTSLIFNRGHRIRVAVSSSNAPRFDPNPNTGDPLRANDRTVVAVNSIHLDAEHPSHILLPAAVDH